MGEVVAQGDGAQHRDEAVTSSKRVPTRTSRIARGARVAVACPLRVVVPSHAAPCDTLSPRTAGKPASIAPSFPNPSATNRVAPPPYPSFS